jgi:hypothetical protein
MLEKLGLFLSLLLRHSLAVVGPPEGYVTKHLEMVSETARMPRYKSIFHRQRQP